MKAERLPSGSWRVRVYRDGIRRSFTASGKKEALALAAEWLTGEHERPNRMTVSEAISKYIDAKEPVLSPSTVVGYRSLARTAYDGIGSIPLAKLATGSAQTWVGTYAANHSPKRVRNACGLLVAAVGMFRPGLRLALTLPAPVKPVSRTPETEQVLTLLEYTRGREPLLYAAILLAAFGTLRRGEVCALRGRDVNHRDCTITVRHAIVETPGGGTTEKAPKTLASARTVSLPRRMMAELPLVGEDDRLIPWEPYQLTHRFRAVAKACGMSVTFHGLRHYAASILHAWGVPDAMVMARGGWSSDVMQRVYREALEEEQRRQDAMVAERICHILATKMDGCEENGG